MSSLSPFLSTFAKSHSESHFSYLWLVINLMSTRFIWIWMFIALSALTAGAQDLSSLREKSIVLVDGKATLDTLLIDPSSVTVKDHDTSDFTVNASSKEIRWKTAPYPVDTIL